MCSVACLINERKRIPKFPKSYKAYGKVKTNSFRCYRYAVPSSCIARHIARKWIAIWFRLPVLRIERFSK